VVIGTVGTRHAASAKFPPKTYVDNDNFSAYVNP